MCVCVKEVKQQQQLVIIRWGWFSPGGHTRNKNSHNKDSEQEEEDEEEGYGGRSVVPQDVLSVWPY